MKFEDIKPNLLKAPDGYVVAEIPYLQKVDHHNLEIRLLSDESVGDYTVRSGTIVSTSTSIMPTGNYLYESPLQVDIGDKVWFHPNALKQLAVHKHEHESRVIEIGDRIFVVIPYPMLIMKLKGGEYYGLNDNIITELVHERDINSIFDMSFTSGTGILHKVIAPALEGTQYVTAGKFNDRPITEEKGNHVIIRNDRKLAIEHSMDIQLPARWFAQQSRYVMAQEHGA